MQERDDEGSAPALRNGLAVEVSRRRNSGTHHHQKPSKLDTPTSCLHRAIETKRLDTTLVRQRNTSGMECCRQREWVEVGRRSGRQVDKRGEGTEYKQLEDCEESHGGVVVAEELLKDKQNNCGTENGKR